MVDMTAQFGNIVHNHDSLSQIWTSAATFYKGW